MTVLDYADPEAAAPSLAAVGVPDRPDDRARFITRLRVAALVPLLVSLGVHWLFAIAYWIPETSAFPARDWWLTQLSPLVSEAVTSDGIAQVEAQWRQPGLGGELLLLAALALFALSRHPRRVVPGAILVPAGLGIVAAVVVAVALLAGGRPSASGLSLVLLALWVVTAGYAALGSLLVDVEVRRPRRWRDGVPLLAAYAVVGPAPTAVGRALFGGVGLRDVAASLQGNTVTLRLAALTNGATVLLYLTGVLVGVVVWAAYLCWPPRRDAVTGLRALLLVGALLLTATLGGQATGAAQRQGEHLRLQSPATSVHFSCGSATLDGTDGDPTRAVRTLVITGLTCKTLTTFEGYRQLTTRTLSVSLAPVIVRDPDGERLTGRVVSAQYGDALVLAASGRIDTAVDELLGIRVEDGSELWRWSCADRRSLRLRFSGVPGGDDVARGHVGAGQRAVVVVCGGQTLRLDPSTGLVRR